jgi:hypothetical protein
MTFLTAIVELGSSRTPPTQWNLTLTRTTPDPEHRGPTYATTARYTLTTGLTRKDAEDLADRLNEFLTGQYLREYQTCAYCNDEITQPATGRPRKYCSPACSQAAYRERKDLTATRF